MRTVPGETRGLPGLWQAGSGERQEVSALRRGTKAWGKAMSSVAKSISRQVGKSTCRGLADSTTFGLSDSSFGLDFATVFGSFCSEMTERLTAEGGM